MEGKMSILGGLFGRQTKDLRVQAEVRWVCVNYLKEEMPKLFTMPSSLMPALHRGHSVEGVLS